MIVKVKLVNGSVGIFTAEKYLLSRLEDMHPDILEAKVMTDKGKVIAKLKRRRQKHYILHEYKPLPAEENQEPEPVPEEKKE